MQPAFLQFFSHRSSPRLSHVAFAAAYVISVGGVPAMHPLPGALRRHVLLPPLSQHCAAIGRPLMAVVADVGSMHVVGGARLLPPSRTCTPRRCGEGGGGVGGGGRLDGGEGGGGRRIGGLTKGGEAEGGEAEGGDGDGGEATGGEVEGAGGDISFMS